MVRLAGKAEKDQPQEEKKDQRSHCQGAKGKPWPAESNATRRSGETREVSG